MRHTILTIIILCINNCIVSQNWTEEVIVRKDNNYVSYTDTISFRTKTPALVKEKIKLFFDKNKIDKYELEYQNNNLIFKISYSENVDLYVVKYCLFANIRYYFFCYDKSNNKFSDEPYSINGSFIENEEEGFSTKLCTTPLLLITDFAHNKKGIILKEREHNGNSYNAVVSHFLAIDKNMNFKPLFYIEEVYLYNSPELNMNDEYVISRIYNNGKVNCRLSINKQKEIEIGSFEIDYKLKKIKNKIILNNVYTPYLITGSGIDENLFLEKGGFPR